MSIPCEKKWALQKTRNWLNKLSDTSYKPNIGEVRGTACNLLRHYPWEMDVRAGFKPNRRGTLNRTYKWLMSLLDRRNKVRIGALRTQARDFLDAWPTEDEMTKAESCWH